MTQVGTPLYISPEIWGNKAYDYKTDMWSMGCQLFEMCAQNYPFLGRNMDDLRKAVMRGRFAPIPNFYSPELTEIIKQLLQLKPQNRPSASSLLQHNIIITKIKDLQEIKLEDLDKKDVKLLGTIKIPWNLNLQKDKLPVRHMNNASGVRRSSSVGAMKEQRPSSAQNPGRQSGKFYNLTYRCFEQRFIETNRDGKKERARKTSRKRTSRQIG